MTLKTPGWHRAEAERYLELAKTSPSGWKHLDTTDLLIFSRTHAELGHAIDEDLVRKYNAQQAAAQEEKEDAEWEANDEKIAEDTAVVSTNFDPGDKVLSAQYFDGVGEVIGSKDGIVHVDRNGTQYSLFPHELDRLQ